MDWLKLNTKGILRGSLARADNVTQLIWIKLLAMASETRDRDGYLRYREGEPYTLEFIAQTCNVTVNDLNIAIDDFMDDIRDGHARVEWASDNSLHLMNWEYYQKKPAEKELPPRIKSKLENEAITRHYTNKCPDTARDTLVNGFGDNISVKTPNGMVNKETGEVII